VFVAEVLSVPTWIAAGAGPTTVAVLGDVIWRKKRPPSDDGRWSVWAQWKYRRRH
jgi:hypothetical protein